MKAEAALERAGRALLLRMARDQRRVRVDVDPGRSARQLPRARARDAMRGPETLKAVGVTRDPVDHPERRRRRRDLPEQQALVLKSAEVRQAVPAVGEHHRQIPDHAPKVVAGPPRLQIAKAQRQRPRQPRLVGHPREQRAARVRHQALSVRRDFYGNPAPIVRHLQGDPPKLILQASRTRRIPAQADSKAAPVPGAAAASCTIRVRTPAFMRERGAECRKRIPIRTDRLR